MVFLKYQKNGLCKGHLAQLQPGVFRFGKRKRGFKLSYADLNKSAGYPMKPIILDNYKRL